MFQKIQIVFNLFDKATQKKVILFGVLKTFLGVFDILGIVLVGSLLAKLSGNLATNSSTLNNFFAQFSTIQIGIFAAIAFLIKSLGSILFSRALIFTLNRANANLAKNLFEHCLIKMPWVAKKYSKSELNFLLISTPGAAIEMLLGAITVISESFLLFSILITFIFVDLEMTIAVIIYFSIITLLLNKYLGKKIKSFGSEEADSAIRLTTNINDSVTAFREIKSFKKELFFLEKFSAIRFKYSLTGGHISFLNSLPKNIVEPSLMLGALGLVAIASTSGNPAETAQSIGIFLAGGLKIMSSILPLQATFAAYSKLIPVVSILTKFIDDSNFVNEYSSKSERLVQKTQQSRIGPVGIEITDVSFKYEVGLPYALNDVDLYIDPGQFVAIVGSSGSGKSTLADLIIGILAPTVGKIKFFNTANEELDLNAISFGYVAQKPGIVSGSIKDNVALGVSLESIDLDKLSDAFENSHLTNLISDLDMGADTDLGKQSDSLSGGQLQRIGLARALYSNPNLLLLDEATSALDAESEFVVSNSIKNLKGKCTIIVIAHRLTTVQSADIVFVVDEGKIVAQGKFADLAKSNEIVSKFIELSEIKTT